VHVWFAVKQRQADRQREFEIRWPGKLGNQHPDLVRCAAIRVDQALQARDRVPV
jgi:hypothetical protein